MTVRPFNGSFTQQEAISEAAIEKAVHVLRSGRLHRYNTVSNEASEASLLEQEFAAYQQRKYCLACASGGYALHIGLVAAGLKPGEQVLTNAFTLAPVPGAIVNAGGRPVFFETDENLRPDPDDLLAKIKLSGARFLLLSMMRGHIPDMFTLMDIVDHYGLILIEDCAHTMGGEWNQRKSGNFGRIGCFSTQTYKHLNSGEGGLLVSDDDDIMARAVMLSGSYMLYERHLTAPPPESFVDIDLQTPNCSGRMDNLRAAILRPQLACLDENITRWNRRYAIIESILRGVNCINLPVRPSQEAYVGSSIQFLIPGISADMARSFVAANQRFGVELKWFGDNNPAAYTSKHSSWQYIESQSLPKTDRILSGLFDMRIPLTFSHDDCYQLGEIIAFCANNLRIPDKPS